MSHRRFFALLVLLALTLAPFGRLGMAHAAPGPSHAAMSGHCGGQSSPGDPAGRGGIDCMIACAAMTAAEAPALAPPAPQMMAVTVALLAEPPGISHTAEPPPPDRLENRPNRFSRSDTS